MTERKRLRDIELLTQSIAHWKRMKADPQNCGEQPYSEYCALCIEYIGTANECGGCPIFEHTGNLNCEDTPWGKASQAWKMVKIGAMKPSAEAWNMAAQEEIDFLEMLKTKLEHQSPTP